ncbi:MAG: hypothetical protein WBK46_00860 [Ruminococcus flavefaciens]|nr:MAG: hypothetical protein BWZ04_02599 [Firmicutes bacterium ADurb.BinA205]HQL99148.1 hypothetical protein [Ruminococcus flavefaciens]
MAGFEQLLEDKGASIITSSYERKGFDPIPLCRDAMRMAEIFEMPLKGDESDIDTLEGILRGLHVDYVNGYLKGENQVSLELMFGVYLGQFILDKCLKQYGFKWEIIEGVPCIAKGRENQVTPIARVHRHIVNCAKEDDVRGLYGVVQQLAEQVFGNKK